jgi:hypothetical protein
MKSYRELLDGCRTLEQFRNRLRDEENSHAAGSMIAEMHRQQQAREVVPQTIIDPPSFWREFRNALGDMARAWEHKIDGLTVLRSVSTLKNGEKWIHVSLSRKSKMPTYEDLARVKRDFFGEDVEAYQVFTKESDHVNVHSFCLHLWAPIDMKRRVANLQDLVDEEGA